MKLSDFFKFGFLLKTYERRLNGAGIYFSNGAFVSDDGMTFEADGEDTRLGMVAEVGFDDEKGYYAIILTDEAGQLYFFAKDNNNFCKVTIK